MLLNELVAFARRQTRQLDAEFRVLVQNSSWIFLSNGFRAVLTFIKGIIIARGLGASSYGTYVLIFAFATTVRELYDLNLASAIIKFGADYRAQGRPDKLVAFIKVGALVSVAVALVAAVTVSLLTAVFYDRLVDVPGLEWYVVACAIAVGLELFDTLSFALLRLFYKFKLNSALNIALGVVELIFIAGVVWLFPGRLEPFLVAMIVCVVCNSAIVNAAAVWELWPELRDHSGAPVRLLAPQRRELTTFLLANSGTRTLQNVMNRGDLLLLGVLSTNQQVGFYEIGRRIAFGIVRIIDPLAISINPQTSKLIAEGRYAEVMQLLRRAVVVLMAPAVVVAALTVVFAKQGLAALLGSEFVPAAGPLFIHLVAACIYAIVFWAAPVLLALGRTVFRFVLAVVALILGAIVALLLGAPYGATGVAIGSLVAKSTLLITGGIVAFKALSSLASSRDMPTAAPNSAARDEFAPIRG